MRCSGDKRCYGDKMCHGVYRINRPILALVVKRFCTWSLWCAVRNVRNQRVVVL